MSRSHVTSVEPVVNDGAKTKRYSSKRDLYGPSLRSTLKMTALAFFLSFNLSTAFADDTCSCSWGGEDGKTLTIKGCPAISDSSCADKKGTANNIIIGTDVTSIGFAAFDGASSLESITIPDSVTSIGDMAFVGVDSLTSIRIPDSVESIGNNAFRNASSLESITLPKGITSIGYSAFRNASSLTSITIPDSVTSIGDWAFTGTGLTSITIPDSVTSIGNYAFARAQSLTSITIPDSVTSIGDLAFEGASSLTSSTIPDSVESIGDFAFSSTGLTSITIPDSVTSIGAGAFANTGLTNIICKGDRASCAATAAALQASGYDGDISYPTDPSQCSGNYGWSGAGCSRKNADGSVPCVSGFVEWDKQCWDEYPFAKKRWTPAEANEWLHDGNDNFVIITFKK